MLEDDVWVFYLLVEIVCAVSNRDGLLSGEWIVVGLWVWLKVDKLILPYHC